ncbi:hypothetical protein D3C71_775670 [compost metagenome]
MQQFSLRLSMKMWRGLTLKFGEEWRPPQCIQKMAMAYWMPLEAKVDASFYPGFGQFTPSFFAVAGPTTPSATKRFIV